MFLAYYVAFSPPFSGPQDLLQNVPPLCNISGSSHCVLAWHGECLVVQGAAVIGPSIVSVPKLLCYDNLPLVSLCSLGWGVFSALVALTAMHDARYAQQICPFHFQQLIFLNVTVSLMVQPLLCHPLPVGLEAPWLSRS